MQLSKIVVRVDVFRIKLQSSFENANRVLQSLVSFILSAIAPDLQSAVEDGLSQQIVDNVVSAKIETPPDSFFRSIVQDLAKILFCFLQKSLLTI